MKCYDTDGDLLKLTQWDVNRVVVVKDLIYEGQLEFQFYNDKSEYAAAVIPTITETQVECKIPNIFLQVSRILTIIIYEKSASGEQQAIARFDIPVERKKKPEDYHTEDDPFIIDWIKLTQETVTLLEQLKQKDAKIDTSLTEIDKSIEKSEYTRKQLIKEADEGRFNGKGPKIIDGYWWEWNGNTYTNTGIAATDNVIPGHNMETITNEQGQRILTVKTANKVEADNTLPIQAAAVYTEIGNIDALLKNI